jgi:hypothetical protein
MQAFFDESEASAETWPAAAISSLTGTALQWKNFDRAWLWILEDPQYDVSDKKGRRVFHTVEFESPEGRIGTVYENWPKEKRESFNSALLDALAHSGVQANAATVIVSEYQEVAQRLINEKLALDEGTGKGFKVFEDKFGFCAFWAMFFVGLEAQRYYPKGTEAFYFFEAGSTYQSFVNVLYDTLIKSNQAEYFRFASKPNFVAKDFAIGLQAADLIAYEAAKHNSHHRDPNPPAQHATDVEGKSIWKTRYPLLHLYTHGLDVRIQHWRKGDLESFFKFRKDGDPYPYDF